KIERLDVSPSYVFLSLDGKQQLRIGGHFSDGRDEDLTHRVLYESNNPDVARVTPDGLVSATGGGETVILIRNPGHIAYARIGVYTHRLANYPHVPAQNFIDDYVYEHLR